MSSPAGASPPGKDEGGFAPWDLVGNAVRGFFTTPAPPDDGSKLYLQSLQSEVFSLAEKTAGGTVQLDAVKQARLEQLILGELPALNPTPEPTKSELISGEWECIWTTEKEINFVVKNGLLGLPWKRTYQTIDSAARSLTNVIELENGALTVGSSWVPDEASNGTRFNFEFKKCSLNWRGFTVPLPPVGRGWGEVIFLDEAMRIQRDIRGDILLAKRVKYPDAGAELLPPDAPAPAGKPPRPVSSRAPPP